MSAATPCRVLILGAGHAGSSAARRLREAADGGENLQISVVSRDNALLWHGLMPQIVSGLIHPQDALVPLRTLLRGVTIYPYEIDTVDLAAKQVRLSRGAERGEAVVEYDRLIIALGSVTATSRFPGLSEHGIPVKTIGDAFHLRNHLIDMLELASAEPDPAERRTMLTFVVAGSGFAGVEICAEMNGFLRDTLPLYPGIRPDEVRVVLLSHEDRILPPVSEELAARALQHLRTSGVEVLLSTSLAGATSTAAILDGDRHLPTHTLVATIGNAPNPVVTALPIQLEHGQIPCDEYGRVKGLEGVYAAGDCAAIPNPTTGQPFPPTLVAAHDEGRRVAENLVAELHGRPLLSGPSEHMQVALLTKGYGLFQSGTVRLDGFLASLLWRATFLNYIPTWSRRIPLMVSWILSALLPRDAAEVKVARTDTILPVRFGAGDVIIRQGEPGSRFYIIVDGEVEVVRRKPDGSEQVLAHLGPGEFFGEMALLRNAERSATVRAVQDTEVLAIARSDFSALVQNMSAWRQAVEGIAATRAAEG